ncbi:hypothetical protein [Shewanella sp.]|uniref:hypothetical protein n=1 Tax=Shewanella sp. TaxID=50422 RepID=UPI003A97B198
MAQAKLNMEKVEHQRLRKMLADMLAIHANRLESQGLDSAILFKQMAAGAERFCNEVLVDVAAANMCRETFEAMHQLERATILCGRAAA